MRPHRVLAGLFGVLALAGCANTTAATRTTAQPTDVRTAHVSELFQAAPDGVAVTYDQVAVPVGAHGAVQSQSGNGTTTVRLAVRGLQEAQWYSAHVHDQPCGAQPADSGPRFQNTVDPVQPSVDPTFTNPQNEIWLDLVTDEAGAGSTESIVTWEFPTSHRPGSVVLHATNGTERSDTEPAPAACITVDF